MNQKNILEVCLSPDLGGLELFMVNCYENFSQKTSCKVVVQKGKKLDGNIESKDKFHLRRNKFFPFIPAKKLAKIIDDNEIDFIHFHWTRDIATVVLAKQFSKRKPKIMQTRNMTMTRFKNDFYHKWLYKNIDIMHAVTYQVKEQLEKFIPRAICPRVEQVYMGTKELEIASLTVESLREKYALEDSFVVGIVGRIEASKGQYLAIEALAELKELDIKLLIVGDTMEKEYLGSLKQKVKVLGIEEKVIFTGFTREVDAHMKLFDINILATPHETFGLVVIEAMMNKVCMIATNKGGPLEIIDNGKDGILFDRTSTNLASKIKYLYKDPAYKERLSLAGYKKAKEMFEADTQLQKLYRLIDES